MYLATLSVIALPSNLFGIRDLSHNIIIHFADINIRYILLESYYLEQCVCRPWFGVESKRLIIPGVIF